KLVAGAEILNPMADLNNKDEELASLDKELENTEKEIAAIEGKLAYVGFVSRATEADVAQECERPAANREATEKLIVQKVTIASL
ncbi:hypothetical protein, partial [Morganella morganii]|uniref:hypothetical protein n=1 Tax=Morganella morganii TaxID=582 RepID=UPI0015F3854F